MSLEFSGLTKSFGSKTIFDGLSGSFTPREIVRITGPSGSGKSTLLYCLGLIDSLDSGSISFNGVQLSFKDTTCRQKYLKNDAGFLFQNFGLVDHWSVKENLLVPLAGTPAKSRKEAVVKALVPLGIQDLLEHKIFTLSGGEQQRVALARLALKKPSLIFADEPTSALDDSNAQIISDTLKALATEGATVILATHDDRLRPIITREFSLASELDT